MEKSQIVLSRRDILLKIKKHHAVIDSMYADCNLIIETFQAANKTEHVGMMVDYVNTLNVLDELRDYIEQCMSDGVANTIKDRMESQQKGGGK